LVNRLAQRGSFWGPHLTRPHRTKTPVKKLWSFNLQKGRLGRGYTRTGFNYINNSQKTTGFTYAAKWTIVLQEDKRKKLHKESSALEFTVC